MQLSKTLKHAGRFSFNPKYSIFRVSKEGKYDFVILSEKISEIVERWHQECRRGDLCGLEIRCDGMTVSLSDVIQWT